MNDLIFKGGGCVAIHHNHAALARMRHSNYSRPPGVPPSDGGLDKKPEKRSWWSRFVSWLRGKP